MWDRRLDSINARSVSSRKKNRSNSVRDGAPRSAAYAAAYWLRRLIEDQELAVAVDQPLIDRAGAHPSVAWASVGLLVVTRPWALKCSSSEQAVLEFAASLVGLCGVNLQKALVAVDDEERNGDAGPIKHGGGNGR
ncbi:hypothetical protein GCM10018966_007730 [Streptomyces yanii]